MADYCMDVSCEAKIRRETGEGFELVFVPYSTTACVQAENKGDAEKLLDRDAAFRACQAVKEVEGERATFQRAKAFGPVYQK